MGNNKYYKGIYKISVISSMFQIHPQTLRQYEKEGFICPTRVNGIRLYSECNVDKLKLILVLTREMGVNWAGIDIILDLKENIKNLDIKINNLQEKLIKLNENGSIPIHKSIVNIKYYNIVKID